MTPSATALFLRDPAWRGCVPELPLSLFLSDPLLTLLFLSDPLLTTLFLSDPLLTPLFLSDPFLVAAVLERPHLGPPCS